MHLPREVRSPSDPPHLDDAQESAKIRRSCAAGTLHNTACPRHRDHTGSYSADEMQAVRDHCPFTCFAVTSTCAAWKNPSSLKNYCHKENAAKYTGTSLTKRKY